jgi:hypothetical protein
MVRGSALSQLFYSSAARPIIERVLSGAGYLAGRLGSGSDVLGLDDDRSHDHDFGCRLTVLVDDRHRALLDPLDAALDAELPNDVDGWPTRFPTSWDGRIRHKVDLHTVHEFAASRLAFDTRVPLRSAEWLCLTGQSVLEVTGGAILHDTTTAYREVVASLRWYPDDLWRYVLAAGWARLAQELPFVGRTGELDDDLGSRVIAARLCRDIEHLAFTVERTWIPYPKWSGTALRGLPVGTSLAEALVAAQTADAWPERQGLLVEAIEMVAERHRVAGFDVPTPAVVPFFDRPFVATAEEIVASLVNGIRDENIRVLPPLGAIEQWCDNVDLLSNPQLRARAVTLYADA